MNPSTQKINKAALAKLILIFVVITGLLTAMSWAIIWFFSGFLGSTGALSSVSGRVFDAYTGEPIPNVEVRLITGLQPAIAHTDRKGAYHLSFQLTQESQRGRLNYYHPDYRPVQLSFPDQPLESDGETPWESVKLAPLAGTTAPDPELLQKISQLRKTYDLHRNTLTRELREIQNEENPNLDTRKREVNLKADLRLLENQKRFLLEDSLAYQLREIDRFSMQIQLEKWKKGIEALQQEK